MTDTSCPVCLCDALHQSGRAKWLRSVPNFVNDDQINIVFVDVYRNGDYSVISSSVCCWSERCRAEIKFIQCDPSSPCCSNESDCSSLHSKKSSGIGCVHVIMYCFSWRTSTSTTLWQRSSFLNKFSNSKTEKYYP